MQHFKGRPFQLPYNYFALVTQKIKMKICGWINLPDTWSFLSQNTISHHQKTHVPLNGNCSKTDFLPSGIPQRAYFNPSFIHSHYKKHQSDATKLFAWLFFIWFLGVLTGVEAICYVFFLLEPASRSTSTPSGWPLVTCPELGEEKGRHWLGGEVQALSRGERDLPVCSRFQVCTSPSLQLYSG